MKKLLYLIALSFLTLSCNAEEEQHPCYNASLIDASRVCPSDCPGICGCDGNTYCNECEANQNGYSTTVPPPCK